jgi:ribosome-binding ATPase YchF (GTP1/OBG family)
LIRAGYHLLGLQTGFTAAIRRAPDDPSRRHRARRAGVIHTDFERGFIRAETVSHDDFVANDGWK